MITKMARSLVLVLLSSVCVSSQINNENLDFSLTPSEVVLCGDQQTSVLHAVCRLNVQATTIYGMEIGTRRGTGGARHRAIARMEGNKATVVDVTMQQHVNQTNFTSQTLTLTLDSPTKNDIMLYYCSAIYVYYHTIRYSEQSFGEKTFTYHDQVPACVEREVRGAVQNKVPATHPKADKCPFEQEDRPEALVMKYCNSSDIKDWKEGPKVMDICCEIPAYTPVATFSAGKYVEDDKGAAGVFVECTPNGFSMAVQLCGHTPMIVNLTRSSGAIYVENPDNYHLILHTDSQLLKNPIIG